jgi:hypothetical protein
MSTQAVENKKDALYIYKLFEDLLHGDLTRAQFDSFVEDMREQPDQLDVLDMEVNSFLVEVYKNRNMDNYDIAQDNDDMFSARGQANSSTPEYQAMAVDIFRWLDANTRNFETNFVSALWEHSYSSVHLKFSKTSKVSTLLADSTMKYPNTETSQLARMFLKSRPEGYFADIGLNHKNLARLGEIIGDRLLQENAHNLIVRGKIFSNDLSL